MRPSIIAIGGLSGSGKSSLARALAAVVPTDPYPLHLNSDAVRKELAGAKPTERLAPHFYSGDFSEKTYREMLDRAKRALNNRQTVILDATFLKPETRHAVEALASQARAPFFGVWLDSDPKVLRARIAARAGANQDVSDATPAVLDMQLQEDPGDMAWSRFETDRAGSEILHAVLGHIGVQGPKRLGSPDGNTPARKQPPRGPAPG